MTAIIWDQLGDRVYETGVDHGVLYFPDGGGVPWNGLISVESHTPSTIDSIYYDGVKVNDIVNIGEFKGTLKAYTYPDEFLEFEGTLESPDGFLLTGQGQQPFHLSYRTIVGNDTEVLDFAYRIHLLWNLIAMPSTRSYKTLSLNSSPIEFEWALTAIPEAATKFHPTAYLIIDSRNVAAPLMEEIHTLLYGSVSTEPNFPSLKYLLDLANV